jgi:hypothetical protein
LTGERERHLLNAKAFTMSQFNSYAPPLLWGPWEGIASHIGSVAYEISYKAVGSTLVTAEVRYFKGQGVGIQVIEGFTDETNVTTADCVANIEVRFTGTPTGSAVEGLIIP